MTLPEGHEAITGEELSRLVGRMQGIALMNERVRELEAQLAEAMQNDVRKWFHYPIEMPLSEDGQGPATVGVDAKSVTYEVWDVLLQTHASFDNLPDAINKAMRLNAEMKGQDDE